MRYLWENAEGQAGQHCHFKKIKNPSWANKKTKKTQGEISID